MSNCADPISVCVDLTNATFARSQIAGWERSEGWNDSFDWVVGQQPPAQIFAMTFGACPDYRHMLAAGNRTRVGAHMDRPNRDVCIRTGQDRKSTRLNSSPWW